MLESRQDGDAADLVAAIAPVSATMATESCNPARPISIQHYHGDADRLNPYEGATSSGGVVFISVADNMQFWTAQKGCPAEAHTSESGSILHEIYAPCDQSVAVELYKLVGGEHAWTGGEAVTEQIGMPNMEISATQLMWEFFVEHPMP